MGSAMIGGTARSDTGEFTGGFGGRLTGESVLQAAGWVAAGCLRDRLQGCLRNQSAKERCPGRQKP